MAGCVRLRRRDGGRSLFLDRLHSSDEMSGNTVTSAGGDALTQPCMTCGKPSGVPMLDPWTLPPGVRAGLVVTCAVCNVVGRSGRLAEMLSTFRPEGETPRPIDEVASVLVRRRAGVFEVIGVLNGAQVAASGGWSTRTAAIQDAAKAFVEATKTRGGGG